MTEFRPATLLANRHAQTIWQAAFRHFVRVPVSTEVWEARDGEHLDIDFLPHQDGLPGVLVIHGLEASSRAPYVRGMMSALHARGVNAAAMNLRGCGPSGHKSFVTYHSGYTDDVDFVIGELTKRWPRMGVIGFSLGANLTLKWLGERNADAPIVAAAAISPPFDLAEVAGVIDGPGFWNGAYRRRFIRSLRRKGLALARRFGDAPLDIEAIRASHNFRTIDEALTVPIHGFDDADHYWREASCGPFIPHVAKPTLILAADDDPLIPGRIIPAETIASNSHVELWRTSRGGHVGFIGGTPVSPRYVAEANAADFVTGAL